MNTEHLSSPVAETRGIPEAFRVTGAYVDYDRTFWFYVSPRGSSSSVFGTRDQELAHTVCDQMNGVIRMAEATHRP